MKTYVLAPNFTFQPGGSIQVRNIITDPFRPTKTVTTLDSCNISSETVTTTDLQTSIRQVKTRSNHGSVWAQFLQTANVHIGAEITNDLTTIYDCDALETVQLKFDPTEEQVTPLLQNGKVQAAMNAGMFGRQPVYVITGLKIARGLTTKTQARTKVGGTNGIGLPVTDQISLGFDVGHDRGNDIEHSFRSLNDIIFAYQLHKISLKGLRTKTTSVNVYTTKSAFLHDQDGISAVIPEVSSATAHDLQDTLLGSESARLDVSEGSDNEEPCVYVVYHEK